MRSTFRRRATGAALALCTACVSADLALGAQNVYLDFVTNPGNGTSTHIYTAGEQSDILARMDAHYAAFDFSFSLTPPTAPFSTITFNSLTTFTGGPLVGGIASEIDFRNLNNSDNARVNVNGLLGGGGQPAATSANFVALSSLIGSHELGHLQGLRHGDAQGPIGSGVATSGIKSGFTPDYPGPVGADESGVHVMGSPASVGQTLNQAVGTTFFGEREDVKLAFNETPAVVNETGAAHGSTGTAQAISLVDLDVPNTLGAGTDNFGKTFDVAALAVIGNVSAGGQQDFYSFTASAGLLEVEVIAGVLSGSRASNLDPQITILDSVGTALAYYGGPNGAFNDDEFESLDSVLLDVILPSAGTYFARVNGFSTTTGRYELFAYTFNAVVPEPGAAGAAIAGLSLLFIRRRRGA